VEKGEGVGFWEFDAAGRAAREMTILSKGRILRFRGRSARDCRSLTSSRDDDFGKGFEVFSGGAAKDTKDRKVTGSPNGIGAWREARCPLKPKEGLNGPPSALMAA
jgi:hypothetical protein